MVNGPAGTGGESSPGAVARYARALGGEAHRTRVRLPAETLPEFLDIATEGAAISVRYRLLRAPRTRRPITDGLGDYLYVPQRNVPIHPEP